MCHRHRHLSMTAPSTAIPAADFAAALDRIGGFEPVPRLAVAVSGGADSLALCLLADAWCRRRGGGVQALTVDHGLRPDSAAEARQVHAWLTERGIAHDILAWTGPKPRSGLQAAARSARYRLLTAFCRAQGLPDLLLGHQLEDQAETFLLRLGMGSGVDGLAGMAAVRCAAGVRLIRPLLTFPHARLEATCRAAGQAWIEDPSNQEEAFTRVRLRRLLADLETVGVGAAAIVASMAKLGTVRGWLEAETVALLDAAATVHPEGWLLLRLEPLRQADPMLAARALERCLRGIGGRLYPLRSRSLEHLFAAVCRPPQPERPPARTLGGCRIAPWSPPPETTAAASGSNLLICREFAAIPTEPVPLKGAEPVWWDRRFQLHTTETPGCEADGLSVAPVGSVGRARLIALTGCPGLAHLPAPVLSTLPGLWREGRLLGLPAIAGRDWETGATSCRLAVRATFAPAVPLGSSTGPVGWTEWGGKGQNGSP